MNHHRQERINVGMVDASDLRILSLSLGGTLAADGASSTDTAKRQVEYGSHFAEYVILVRTPNHPDIYQSRNLSNTVRVIPTLRNNSMSTLLRMIHIGESVLRQRRFDAITVQEPFLTGFAGSWLKRRFALPLQVQLHGDLLDNPYWIKEKPINRLLNLLGKWVLSQADTVRTVNQADQQWIMRQFGFPAKRIVCAPVRADLTLFESACGDVVRADYAQRGFQYLVLFVGELAKHKGVAVLPRMFAQVAEDTRQDQACLSLVGDGSERPVLESLASNLGIAHLVDFVGFLPPQDVAEYMAAANVFVLPSRREGFGRVLVEAGAAGRPCVATACSGPSDILRDEETGYLVPIGDTATMAQRVLYLLKNPEIANTMGLQAHKHVLGKYDPRRLIMENVESLRLTAELGLRNRE